LEMRAVGVLVGLGGRADGAVDGFYGRGSATISDAVLNLWWGGKTRCWREFGGFLGRVLVVRSRVFVRCRRWCCRVGGLVQVR
jgi:hypothetical protein